MGCSGGTSSCSTVSFNEEDQYMYITVLDSFMSWGRRGTQVLCNTSSRAGWGYECYKVLALWYYTGCVLTLVLCNSCFYHVCA